MPVPDYQTLMLPVLQLLADGRGGVRDCLPEIRRDFEITDEEAAELIPSGRVTVLSNRAHWARTYLSKAGLLRSNGRGRHEVTEAGRKVLAERPERIDNAFLTRFDAFNAWREASAASRRRPANGTTAPVSPVAHPIEEQGTPVEAIEAAVAKLNASLADDLLDAVIASGPARFERLTVELLVSMGYGGGDPARGLVQGRAGDGGIDGIVNEDALGLDAVYIQAKCYASENRIGRPDVQRFIGSMTGEGATKGVFVTTSTFTQEARDFVARLPQRIVLIDGPRLARLMIAHEVGVRTTQTFRLRDIDENWFPDE